MKFLSDQFYNSYKDRAVPMDTLGWAVYTRTYAQRIDDRLEKWYETLRRGIESVVDLGCPYTKDQAALMYDHQFHMRAFFSGRAMWQLGRPTVAKLGGASINNCYMSVCDTIKVFAFAMDMLMLGGGVGLNVQRKYIRQLPRIPMTLRPYIIHRPEGADWDVPDTREGWIELVRRVFEAFFVTGKGFTYSTRLLRPKGALIKGFGGRSSGPAPLTEGVESLCKLLQYRRDAYSGVLDSVTCADILCVLGRIVVSGNVRRCLPGDARVHTRRGAVKIKDVVVGQDEAMSHDGNYYPITDKFEQGVQRLVSIKHQDGEFKCTPNHRMAVMTSPKSFVWRRAEQLQPGDRLLFVRHETDGVGSELPEFKYEYPEHSTTCNPIRIPPLDEEMAWFLGMLHANGCVYANRKKNGFNAYVNVITSYEQKEIAKRAAAQMQRFGQDLHVTVKLRHFENSYMAHCVSKQLAWYLDENFKKPNTPLQVPECIWKAKPSVRMAYLAGVMDGDGSAQNRPVCLVTSVYKEWVEELQKLLASCGIESRVSHQSKHRESRPKHWKRLSALNLITLNSKDLFGATPELYKGIKRGEKSRRVNGFPSNWITDGKIKQTYGLFQAKQLNIDSYGQSDWCPVEVKSVEFAEEAETWDITVDEVHSFVCNGLLTHNSALIVIGDPDDKDYLKAKSNLETAPPYRSMANYSVACDDVEELPQEFWDNYEGGAEPYGLVNFSLARVVGRSFDYQYPDPYVNSVNPCAEITGAAEEGEGEGESCNLATVTLSRVRTYTEFKQILNLLYWYLKTVSNMPYHHPSLQKVVHQNNRLGMSVSGVWDFVHRYGESTLRDWLIEGYSVLRNLDESQVRWGTSIKMTSVQPDGTKSLLSGASPGAHPHYARYAIRRVRLATNDPLIPIFEMARYNIEQARTHNSVDPNTLVVDFPIHRPNTVYGGQVSAIDQIDMLLGLQSDWADNSVSSTIYFTPPELPAIKEKLRKHYRDGIKTISFLPYSGHGFLQAPYEPISEERYVELSQNLVPIDMNQDIPYVENIEIDDTPGCEKGVCPPR